MLKITLLALCLVFGITNAKPALDETAAQKYIAESSDKFSELYNELAETVFELASVVDDDSKEKEKTKANSKENEISTSDYDSDSDESEFINGFLQLFILLATVGRIHEAAENLTTLADETYRFPIEEFKDKETIIGLLKLRTTPGLFALPTYFEDWTSDDFDDLLGNENFCKWKSEEKKCNLKYSDILKIVSASNDPEELLYYWKEWRERNGEEAFKKMKTFIELFKKLGEKFKKTAKFAWFSEFLDENFGNEMEKVVQDLQPLFKELHAYIRYILRQQYGDKVPEHGYIPYHLYEQAMVQAWKPDSTVSTEFKGVKMPIQNNFKESPKEIVDMASNFMKSLGFDDLPEEFWTKRVKETKGDDCNGEVYDGANITFFKYCHDVNIKKFLQMHGYMARIYYANERKHLPFAYLEPYNLELATGESIILSAHTPKYLHEIGHKDVSELPEDEDMNRLFRMGVHTILSVPEYFIHAKVVSDVLDDTVPVEKMNEHYWELMKKYLGVAAPVERTEKSMDFPEKFYKSIEHNAQSAKFATEVMGYQIYEALCKKTGEYVEGEKTHPLHRCNFHNKKEAGDSLKEMMKIGGKNTWQEVLGTVTGHKDGMKAEAMLHYFAPLKTWLETKNKEHGVTVGW